MYSFGSLLLKECQLPCHGTLKQPVMWGKTKAPACQPCEWDMMEADFPDPVKHLDDCILTQHPDCDFIENCEVRCTQPNCF